MSTERVSDEELAVLIERATRRADYKERTALHELQQRRATDRRVIEACCKFKDGEINVHGLYKAISELLP